MPVSNIRSASRFFVAAVFALLVMADCAWACAGCSYERMLNTNWHEKVFCAQVICVVLLTCDRLDPIRVLYTWIPLTVLNIKLQVLSMGLSEMRLASQLGIPPVFEPLLSVGVGITHLGIAFNALGVAAMFAMGGFRFYRRDPEKGIRWWQPVLYAVALLAVNVVFLRR